MDQTELKTKEPQMNYVFPPTPQASIAVAGSEDRIPVRRIFCVGRT